MFKRDQWNPVAIATAVLLVLAVLLGGASRQNELRLALVELAALPALVLAILALTKDDGWASHRFALGVLAAIVALPLLQLIPLPPAVWTNLPGRGDARLALEIAGLPIGWNPMSLTPDKTWRSVLALLPPIAMFLGVLASPVRVRGRLIQLTLALCALSILLGAAQLASGGERLYPWTTTDAGSVVGFFANRNHLATFCVMSIPIAALLTASGGSRYDDHRQNTLRWIAITFLVLAIAALAAIRSRAGVILVTPALVGGILALTGAGGWNKFSRVQRALSALAAVTILVLAVFASGPILNRFDQSGVPEGRFENWPTVASAADAFLPFGSGLGSFDPVYRSVEPLERLDATFFNQAHNDYLETWLEAGWLGVGVLIAFLIWYGRRALASWVGPTARNAAVERAASVGIALALIHSAADYPLRTTALAVVFALCCALLEQARRLQDEPPGEVRVRRRVRTSPT